MPYTFKETHYIVHVQSYTFPHGSCEFPSGMLKHHKNSEIASTVSYLFIYLFIYFSGQRILVVDSAVYVRPPARGTV